METKIGVFLCNCGGAMKNIDLDVAAKEVAKLADVTSVIVDPSLCLEEGRRRMLAYIKEGNVERVVVAGCSAEFGGPIFREVLEKAGLNGHLLSIANIREQCSWVHDGDVTAKAVELVKMAVSRVRLLQPMETKEMAVSKGVLVVGSGFSALSTALGLSQLGLRVTALTEEPALKVSSGELPGLHGFDTDSITDAVKADKNIKVLNSARVLGLEGDLGDFRVRIGRVGQDTMHKYGAIVVATGYRTEFASARGPKSGSNVVSQEQFHDMLLTSNLQREPKTIAFMLDFTDESSRFPTLATLSNALAAKKKWGSEVYVFYKSVKVDSQGVEKLYQQARDCGVVFCKCETPPRISSDDGRVRVEARDVFVGEDVVLGCDVVVGEELCLPATGTETFSSLLNVRRDAKGFCQDEDVHLYPVGSGRNGIFFVGECRGELDLGRIMADVSGVVAQINVLLSPGKITVDFEKVKADPQKCVACLTCVRVCPHGAIHLVRVDSNKEVAQISDLACDACGVCAAICPAKAITFKSYRDEEILAQIEAIGRP